MVCTGHAIQGLVAWLRLTAGPHLECRRIAAPDIGDPSSTHTSACHDESLTAERLSLSYGCRGLFSAAVVCTAAQIISPRLKTHVRALGNFRSLKKLFSTGIGKDSLEDHLRASR